MPDLRVSDEESLSEPDFARLRSLIRNEVGICLGPEKKTMVEARLKRRLRALNMSYGQYCGFVFRRGGSQEELLHLIDVITTNKTDFFREPAHFNFLIERALPELSARIGGARPVLVWSAGCSSGEEPYTLAMVLGQYAAVHASFRFRVLATDISTAMLEKARCGIYSAETIAPVTHGLRQRYFLRSRDRESSRVRIIPELRRAVEFRRVNFMDSDYGLDEMADAIFCRNVLIYFDRPTQQAILSKIIEHLIPGGYLFVGHSETLHDMDLPVNSVAPALYQKVAGRG